MTLVKFKNRRIVIVGLIQSADKSVDQVKLLFLHVWLSEQLLSGSIYNQITGDSR